MFSESQKLKFCWSAWKWMFSLLWHSDRVVYFKFMQWGTTVYTNVYCDTLTRLHKAFSRKTIGYFPWSLVLQHEKARRTQSFHWEIFCYLLFSPHHGPWDYYLLGQLNEADSAVMKKCDRLFVNGCECKNSVYTAMDFLQSWLDWKHDFFPFKDCIDKYKYFNGNNVE